MYFKCKYIDGPTLLGIDSVVMHTTNCLSVRLLSLINQILSIMSNDFISTAQNVCLFEDGRCASICICFCCCIGCLKFFFNNTATENNTLPSSEHMPKMERESHKMVTFSDVVFPLWFERKIPKRVAIVATTATSTVAGSGEEFNFNLFSAFSVCCFWVFCARFVCPCVCVFPLLFLFLGELLALNLDYCFSALGFMTLSLSETTHSRSLSPSVSISLISISWSDGFITKIHCNAGCCCFFLSLKWKDITWIQSHFIRI